MIKQYTYHFPFSFFTIHLLATRYFNFYATLLFASRIMFSLNLHRACLNCTEILHLFDLSHLSMDHSGVTFIMGIGIEQYRFAVGLFCHQFKLIGQYVCEMFIYEQLKTELL